VTFSEFAKMLFPFCGNGANIADFVLALTDGVMESPPGDDAANPLYDLQPDALRRIYNGNRGITPQNASVILGRLDKGQFAEYLERLSTDALDGLCTALNGSGIDANIGDVRAVCADLFEQILKACVTGDKRGAKTETAEFGENLSANAITAALPTAPLASVYIVDGKIHIGGAVIKLPERLLPPAKITKAEMGYVPKLFEAYTDAEKPKTVTQNTLAAYPRYLRNFKEQREHYYNAVYVFERVRGVFADSEGNQFDILKQETYDGISEVYADEYDDGFERLIAVLKQAAVINVHKSLLCNIRNLIGISEVKGVCHILVSDGVIPSWVTVYG
jgi:hypothetical protein